MAFLLSQKLSIPTRSDVFQPDKVIKVIALLHVKVNLCGHADVDCSTVKRAGALSQGRALALAGM